MTKRLALLTLYALLSLPISFCLAEIENINGSNSSYFETLQAELQESKIAIQNAEKKWVATFDERSIFYDDKLERLSAIDQKLKQNWNYADLLQDYNFVVDVWRKFADHSFDNISGAIIERSFPTVPQLDNTLAEKISVESYSSLQDLNNEVTRLFNQSLAGFDARQEKDSLKYSKVLLAAGKLRSQQYQRLQALGYTSTRTITKNNIEDFVRELRIIPVRWTATFYSKLLEFRDYSRSGIEGYLYITKELILFLCLISFGIFFVWTFHKFVAVFESYAERMHKKLATSSTHWIWMYGLTVLNKSIPWVLLLMGVWFAIGLVEVSSVRELSNLFPYIDFYIYYRLYLISTDDFFTRLKSVGLIDPKPNQKLKLFRINRSMGRFLFISIAILHTINTVVGKAMIYSIAFNVLYTLGGLYIIYLTSRWSEEILNSKEWLNITKRLPSSLQSKIKRFHLFSSFIVLLVIVGLNIFDWTISYLSKFDSFKKLSALMLRARLNKVHDINAGNGQKPLPESYITHFNPSCLTKEFITKRKQFIQARDNIENWISQGATHHSMLVYGSNGSGKSIMLSELKDCTKGANSYFIDLKDKETKATGIIRKLQKILGGESDDPEKLIKFWKSNINKKTIIYIDNTHNLFLSQLHGFEAMRTLMDIINSDIDNIFWCVSFHRESWHFIRRALREYLCFDQVLELPAWSAEELQDYIMTCHARSGFKVSFDKILTILGKKKGRENRDTIESRFFKLLWEQTEGNPTRAVALWLKSLNFDGHETMMVLKPPLEDMSDFLDLDDDIHFMCASLIRHESLEPEQIGQITNQDKGIVTRVIKRSIERRLIVEHENNTFRLNPDLAGYIIRSLRRKNYVYG